MFKLFDRKLRYFKRKVKAAMYKVWDIEFEKYILRDILNDKRSEYDGTRMRLEALVAKMTADKDPKVTEKEKEVEEFLKRLADKEQELETAKTANDPRVPQLEQELPPLKARKIEILKELQALKSDEYKRLEDEKTLLEIQIDRLLNGREDDKPEAGIKALDVLVNGAKPSKEYPNGYQGATQRIEAAYEVVEKIKKYMKGL